MYSKHDSSTHKNDNIDDMADYVTKQDVQGMITGAVDELAEIIGQFSARVDERFNHLEEQADKLGANFEHLTNTLDTFLKRLDDMEINNAARDKQLERLEAWIKQVAQKTGIKLEY